MGNSGQDLFSRAAAFKEKYGALVDRACDAFQNAEIEERVGLALDSRTDHRYTTIFPSAVLRNAFNSATNAEHPHTFQNVTTTGKVLWDNTVLFDKLEDYQASLLKRITPTLQGEAEPSARDSEIIMGYVALEQLLDKSNFKSDYLALQTDIEAYRALLDDGKREDKAAQERLSKQREAERLQAARSRL